MRVTPDDLEASIATRAVPAGQNAVTAWLHAATPRVLFVPPQLVRRAVVTLAFAGAMSARANLPPRPVATTSVFQLHWVDPQAVGQRISFTATTLRFRRHAIPANPIRPNHVRLGLPGLLLRRNPILNFDHRFLLSDSADRLGVCPRSTLIKWTGTLPRVLSQAAAVAISVSASTCSTPAHPRMKSLAFCAWAPAMTRAFESDLRNLSQFAR